MNADTVLQVAELEKLCFSDPWSLRSLRSELKNERAVYYTAVENGEVLGYAGLHNIWGEGHITNVAVSPLHRRRGIASLLVQALVSYADAQELDFLTLEVRASNLAAIALYEGFGFQHMGARPGYYSHPREDALIMTKNMK